MAGGYQGATPTNVTSTTMAWTEADRRGPFGAGNNHASSVNKTPRLLQPVTNIAAITLANGFRPDNLRPGDILCTMTEETIDGTATSISLNIRNRTNNGWYRVVIPAGTVGGPGVAMEALEVADA